jgi:transposase-like protein
MSHPAAIVAAPDLFNVIDRAARRAGIALKEVALSMGITPAQLSRELHGNGHLALDRMWACPPSFLSALAEELRIAWGGERAVTAREVLDLIRPQMARARVLGMEVVQCA